MNKIKDIIYDKNDIVLAVIILACAALLILWRLNAIIDYPVVLAEQAAAQQEVNNENASKQAKETEKKETAVKENTKNKAADELWENGVTTKQIQVTVTAGDLQTAVESLVAAGLFESYAEYEKVCNSQGIDPAGLKGATFTINAGATKEDIALLVTQ